jgi:hypothetical protein
MARPREANTRLGLPVRAVQGAKMPDGLIHGTISVVEQA